MKAWPEFNEDGDLPLGVHSATLDEVVQHFGATARRIVIARRLERIYQLAHSTGHLATSLSSAHLSPPKLNPTTLTSSC
jgi:hypothetical protein